MKKLLVLVTVGIALTSMTGCAYIGKGKGKGPEPMAAEPITK